MVQPWEDLPPGRVLPVVNPDAVAAEAARDEEQKSHPARVEQSPGATNIVAVPVRTSPQRAESVRDETLRPTDEGDFWFDTVQALIASESITALARELALQAQLVARDTDQWLLRVERESLNQSGARDRLTTALQGAGHPVRLAIEMGRVSDNPARRIRAAQQARQLGAEKIVEDDPLVQGLVQRFGAKIVPASIKPL
ncbi:MAG: DNA polymerase III subunit gamma/tau C-terminal domain-containing protein [Rhodoferax sp.]